MQGQNGLQMDIWGVDGSWERASPLIFPGVIAHWFGLVACVLHLHSGVRHHATGTRVRRYKSRIRLNVRPAKMIWSNRQIQYGGQALKCKMLTRRDSCGLSSLVFQNTPRLSSRIMLSEYKCKLRSHLQDPCSCFLSHTHSPQPTAVCRIIISERERIA